MQKPENYIGHHENQQTDEQRIDRFSLLDPKEPEDWLAVARDAFENSTTYFDSNIRKQIEKNISLFRNKHPQGSKYYTDSYKYRSKVFRPKVRAMTRRHEAAAAMAFFGTNDVVSCEAEDQSDFVAVKGAEFAKNWLEYRLTHTLKWFKTLIGGYQDAMVSGVVISRQEWEYEEEEYEAEDHVFDQYGLAVLDPENQPMRRMVTKTRVKVDRPNISIVPIENFRFSTGADWLDPIKSSPFLVEIIPMFVCDVRDRMLEPEEKEEGTEKKDNSQEKVSTNEQHAEGDILPVPEGSEEEGLGDPTDDNKGNKRWHYLTDGEILGSLRSGDYDSTRSARLGKRMDPMDESYNLSLFDIVWVHRNIIKQNDQDMIFYTLGTEYLLSDPVPLEDVYKHGRPYTMGHCLIETHKNYPSGLPELAQDLTTEANDLANQRLDNIKLILNKRYKAVRGSNTDWKALTSSVPGGVILMDDLNDVAEESLSDVTSSAYEEQNRINLDFDELMGNFSVGSVANNRSLNETVGGMSMALDDSNIITEYQLRVIAETWIEPLLTQLLEMGKAYETDETVLNIVSGGDYSPEVVLDAMSSKYKVNISVGFGATSPHKKIERMSVGIETLAKVVPGVLERINEEEVTKEVFGALGYRDGSRFVIQKSKDKKDEDPRIGQLEKKIQELTQMLQQDQVKTEAQLKVAQIREQGQTQREQLKIANDKAKHDLDIRIAYIKEQIAAEKNDITRGELLLEQEALEFKKREQELTSLSDENHKLSEVLMNDRYGMVPAAEG